MLGFEVENIPPPPPRDIFIKSTMLRRNFCSWTLSEHGGRLNQWNQLSSFLERWLGLRGTGGCQSMATDVECFCYTEWDFILPLIGRAWYLGRKNPMTNKPDFSALLNCWVRDSSMSQKWTGRSNPDTADQMDRCISSKLHSSCHSTRNKIIYW